MLMGSANYTDGCGDNWGKYERGDGKRDGHGD